MDGASRRESRLAPTSRYGVEVGVVELGVVVVLVGGVLDVGVDVGVDVVLVVMPVVVVGAVVVDAVEAADGSVVPIGVLVPVEVPVLVEVPALEESELESEPFTFDVAAVAAPLTLSLMTGAACWTLGLLFTRVAA